MTDILQDTLAAVGYAKVIVELKPAVIPATATAASTESALAQHFRIPSEQQTESLAAMAVRHASKRFKRPEPLDSRKVRVYPRLGLAIGFVDRSGASALAADNRVGAVVPAPELSLIKPVASRTAKATAETTWGITRLNVPRLWAAGITGKDVLVGHLDTGVDGTHPALKDAIAKFAEFDMAGDLVNGATASDSGEHGTHTAGTIVGRPSTRGAFGVAPGAKLASGMVIEGGQVIDRVLAGMEWVVSQNVRILSMSLGLRGFTPAFQVVIDALRRNEVLPVIAVGNEGPSSSRSPGNYANVLSVGAMDSSNRVADFSSSQNFDRADDPLVPDLVAPGVAVLSCVPGGGFAEMDGSSMATPHVAGFAALLFQAKPDATAQEVETAILQSSRRPASMPQARANRGVPDAVAAFTALTGGALLAASKPSPTARRPRVAAGSGVRDRGGAKRPAATKRRAAATRGRRAAKRRNTRGRKTRARN